MSSVASLGAKIEHLTWYELEQRAKTGAVGLLPIGASAKEHGYHLPLNTDWQQAEWLADQLIQRDNVLVWPTLGYGYYPVFVEYPGSITLSQETFGAVVDDILAGIARAGIIRCALLNTGISTIAPLQKVLERAPASLSTMLINVYAGPRFTETKTQLEEQAWGGHADEIETSIMLTLAPEQVQMARAEPAPVRIERGLFNRSQPNAPNYSPSGANGDPSKATPEKGQLLLAAMLEDVRDALAA